MELIKNLLKYLFLLIAIVFVVGIISFVAMFISYKINPDNPIKIFGYSYFGFNIDKQEIETNSSYSSIEVSSNYSNITITGTNESAVHIEVKNKMFGVAKLEEGVEYTYTKNIEENTLKIALNEPKGLFINNASASIVVYVPTNYSAKNIVVNSDKAAVTIGNSSKNFLNANNITVNANNNKVSILNTKNGLNDVTINSKNSLMEIYSKIAGKLTVQTGVSTLNFKEVNDIEINAYNLNLNGNTLNSDLNISSKWGIVKLNTVNGDLTLDGNIKTTINNLNGSYLDTNRTNAHLVIENVTGEVKTAATSGTTTINNCKGKAEITSTNGNIKVLNVASNLTINTNSALCTVEFADEVEDESVFTFNSKNGSLTATKISSKANINVKDDGVCKINLAYKKIVGENIINGKKGNITITAPIQPCVLTVNTNSTKELSYADVTTSENFENKLVAGATDTCADKLLITATTGKISLKSTVEE